MEKIIIDKNKNEKEAFLKKKTKFFSDFALIHKEYFKLHKKYGIFEKENENWKNVAEHCLLEGVEAKILGEKLNLSGDDINNLISAAILHDFYKKEEIKIAEKMGSEYFDVSLGIANEILKNWGFSEEIIRLVNSVGHDSLNKFIKTDTSLSEKIIHYIDDITLGNEIVELDKRIDLLEANPNYKSLNESGREIFGGKTYFEVQRDIGHNIEKELSDKLNLKNSKELPVVLKEEIQKRIEKINL